jgi:hypothetical protein
MKIKKIADRVLCSYTTVYVFNGIMSVLLPSLGLTQAQGHLERQPPEVALASYWIAFTALSLYVTVWRPIRKRRA